MAEQAKVSIPELVAYLRATVQTEGIPRLTWIAEVLESLMTATQEVETARASVREAHAALDAERAARKRTEDALAAERERAEGLDLAEGRNHRSWMADVDRYRTELATAHKRIRHQADIIGDVQRIVSGVCDRDWTLNDLLSELHARGIDGIELTEREVAAALEARTAEDAAERIRRGRESMYESPIIVTRSTIRKAITAGADIVRQQLPEAFRDTDGRLPEMLHAADRLARYAFDLTHSEECEGAVDMDEECESCADGSGPCECTCGIDAARRDALIVRPQGAKDPQPQKAGPDDVH